MGVSLKEGGLSDKERGGGAFHLVEIFAINE